MQGQDMNRWRRTRTVCRIGDGNGPDDLHQSRGSTWVPVSMSPGRREIKGRQSVFDLGHRQGEEPSPDHSVLPLPTGNEGHKLFRHRIERSGGRRVEIEIQYSPERIGLIGKGGVGRSHEWHIFFFRQRNFADHALM
jgi:hypothetical protein